MKATRIKGVSKDGSRFKIGVDYEVCTIDFETKTIVLIDDRGEKAAAYVTDFLILDPMMDEKDNTIEKQYGEINDLTKKLDHFRGLWEESIVTIERLNKENDRLTKYEKAYKELRKQVDSFVNVSGWKLSEEE